MKNFLVVITMLFIYFPILAQTKSELYSGRVIDTENEAIPYAIVSVMNMQGSIILNSTCSEEGVFRLPETISKGNYILKISCVGYDIGSYEISLSGQSYDLGDFVINGVYLDAVVVEAERQNITAEVDKLVYHVDKDPNASKMNSLQVLTKIPFITLKKETQEIEVMNTDNFSILVNGKKSLMLSEANQYVAKALAASNLKEIELVTSPDGAYINKTAVINIVTKSQLPEGLVGQIGLSYSTDTELSPQFKLTSKIGKLIYNIDYKYTYSDKRAGYTTEYTEDYVNGESIEGSQMTIPRSSRSHILSLNTSYDISNQDLLTLKLEGSMTDNNRESNSVRMYETLKDKSYIEEQSVFTENLIDNNSYGGSLNFQHSFKNKPGRLLTATYSLKDVWSKYRYLQTYTSENMAGSETSHIDAINKLSEREQVAALDFYNPLKKNQSYYFTAMYTHRQYGSSDEESSSGTAISPASGTDLHYTQQVLSIGGNYSYRSAKLMLTANASLEYTKNNISYGIEKTGLKDDGVTFLAELRTTYKPTFKNWLILSLSRNAFRPDIRYLNPYQDKSVPGVITVGNPNLKNQIMNRAVLMHRFFWGDKITLMTLLGYIYSSDVVDNYKYIEGDNIISTYDNIANSQRIWISFSPTWTPADWLEIAPAILYGYRKFANQDDSNSYPELNITLNLSADLWKGGSFSYMGGWVDPKSGSITGNSQFVKSHLLYYDSYNLSQFFGQRLQISVELSNPWQKHFNMKEEVRTAQMYSMTEELKLARYVYFNVKYNFGKFKQKVKEVSRKVQNRDRERE